MQQSGPVAQGPLCPSGLCNGDTSLIGSPSTDMPDLVGPIHTLNPRKSPNFTYFDQSAFTGTTCNLSQNAAGTQAFLTGECGSYGSANRRFFHGPGINNTDLGLQKNIPVTEGRSFEIRGEFFNIFNHAQFSNPNNRVDLPQGGSITGTSHAMRQIQFGLKVLF